MKEQRSEHMREGGVILDDISAKKCKNNKHSYGLKVYN